MDQTCYTHPVSGCFGCGVCPLRLYYDTLATSSYNIDLRAVTIVRPQLRYLICLLVTVKCFCNRFFVTDSSPHTLIDAWSPQPLGCTHSGPATAPPRVLLCIHSWLSLTLPSASSGTSTFVTMQCDDAKSVHKAV